MHSLTAALFLPPRRTATLARTDALVHADAQAASRLTPTWLGRLVQPRHSASHAAASEWVSRQHADDALDLDQRIRLVGEW
jgi:hypothetical protein